jgi:small subunit ribosomal protein S15
MSLTVEKKSEVIDAYSKAKGDTGSVEVQTALLTERIKELSAHLEGHSKDNSSRRGLLKLVGRRRSLLEYLKGKDTKRYEALIGKLGLRR